MSVAMFQSRENEREKNENGFSEEDSVFLARSLGLEPDNIDGFELNEALRKDRESYIQFRNGKKPN